MKFNEIAPCLEAVRIGLMGKIPLPVYAEGVV